MVLEGKDIEAMDMLFTFVALFIDPATDYVQLARTSGLHTMYMELVNRITKD